ncbi:hypothetical protein N7492_003632 [Penicillium capsulatum]|uniref:C2H2-type domain-containing protein n=1 Tax=Penicillium capsulatum TaxID=69766 RepID=A0A9W9IM98_9EURO|nr:hypothetical protein N7492_003632 [Penicillium capsulatum]KAJ6121786.1 hypothetical protein N7512_004251 [Penicillium capsulatum]
MEDPQLSWPDSSDVLQGIMVGPDGSHPDLSDFRPSSLAMDPASNPLLDLHLGTDMTLDAHSHPSFLPWSSSEPQDFYYPHIPSRLATDQDAWNPLQVTGVPHSSSVSHMNVPPVGDPDCAFSKPHYSPPSESGSQYMGSFHSADSGYGSASCATQSVAYGVDAKSSPQIGAKEHGFGEPVAFLDHSSAGAGSMFPGDFGDAQSFETAVKCDHPTCTWMGKCPSDKRKHEARHRKSFKCDEPNCPRKEGFGTINDLARHKKCVHNKEPERGPKMMYLCFGKNCPRPNKRWPRLDNFKQHLSRMHHGEDADALLKRSMDWYDSVIGSQADHKLDDASSQDEQMLDMDVDSSDVSYPPPDKSFLSSRAPTPRPAQFDTKLSPSQYSNLGSFGFNSPMSSDRTESAVEPGDSKPEAFVSDAADHLIGMMTKMMDARERKFSQQSDEGIDVEPQNSQSSQPHRQMLQKVLSVALERLSDDVPSATEPSDNKQDWFQCDICSKQTRLRCEMKKHQKRHERPYGCTFPHCAKSFGSKADWKRHESSQHLNFPSWLCAQDDTHKGASCGRIFHREEAFSQHLSQQHRIAKNRVKETLQASRLDLADQSHFWCGFCNNHIALRNDGPTALDERFNHIDTEHFKKGQRGSDWCPPSESSSLQRTAVVRNETTQLPDTHRLKRKCPGL